MDARTISAAQARSMSNMRTDMLLREAITRAHQRVIQVHVDDYSRTNAAGDVRPPVVDGPVFVSRAFAMVHIAMYDAFVGIGGNARTYLRYDSLPEVATGAPSHPTSPLSALTILRFCSVTVRHRARRACAACACGAVACVADQAGFAVA